MISIKVTKPAQLVKDRTLEQKVLSPKTEHKSSCYKCGRSDVPCVPVGNNVSVCRKCLLKDTGSKADHFGYTVVAR